MELFSNVVQAVTMLLAMLSSLTTVLASWWKYSRVNKEIIQQDIRLQTLVMLRSREVVISLALIPIIAKVSVFLSAGDFEAVREAIMQAESDKDPRGKALKATVAGIMVHTKAAANARTYAMLVGALFLYILTTAVTGKTNPTIVSVLLGLMFLVYVNQRILAFRIRKGYYGFNFYEAKEIISFILSHSDKTDFKDGDGLKDILPEAEMDSTYMKLGVALPEVQI